MEKDFRLFVKNLPLNIDEARVQDLLSKHVTVKKIDLKEKKDLDNKLHKFAFVNVTTTDKQLYNCFGALNAERIDGFEISVEIAKESFLERLKREREENQAKQEAINLPPVKEYPKPILPDSLNTASQSKHKKFAEDFTPDIQIKNVKLKKRKIEDEEPYEEPEQYIEQEYPAKSEKLFTFEEECPEKTEKSFKKEVPFKNDYSNKSESKKVERKLKINFKNIDGEEVNKKSKTSQDPKISESERRRQLSMKQKKSVFKAQEQIIRNALRSVDTNKSNNKVIFDDDIDLENFEKDKPKVKNDTDKKKALFDSDDEDGDQEKIEWNEEELEAKSQINQKLMKLQAKIGYDKRFVLDERFIEDENEEENKDHDKQPESTEEPSITDEKKWQLDILKDVLGETTTTPTKDTTDTAKRKNKMIRYDPTASNHQDFEINVEKPKKEKPVKKKREIIERVEEPVPEVSKDIFFDVANLAIGQPSGGFSLLKSNDDEANGEVQKNESSSAFKFNFDTQPAEDNETKKSKKDKSSMFNMGAKSLFKYNSSDDEGDDKEPVENGHSSKSEEFGFVLAPQENSLVFFIKDDPRFKEAATFFKTPVLQEEGDFKNKRRGLKEIVRSKIRNNLKKKIPWNKKKIRHVQKHQFKK